MGDVVRTETRRRGLEPNPSNTREVMLDLRAKQGPGAIALGCISLLAQTKSPLVVIEGCRSIDEIDVFDDYAEELTIICVHSSPTVRFNRLKSRQREDAPQEWSIFRERDLRELSVGLGNVIALSDIMIVNECSLSELRSAISGIMKRFL
jgi:dephospho-CoA kinase